MRKPNLRKTLFIFIAMTLVLAFLLSVNALFPKKAYADTVLGWHLVETKYHLSSVDYSVKGEIQNSVMGTTGYIYDKHTIEGSEGDMTITASRRNEKDSVAHVTYQVIWDTPPAYLASGHKTGFNIEYKAVSASGSWAGLYEVSAIFDMAGLTPGSATAGSMRFYSSDGEGFIGKDMDVYFESYKAIPEGRLGDKKAIILSLGDGYGYVYTYEWKEAEISENTTPETPAAPQASDGAEPFESGVRIMWQPAKGLGYRLYRSTSQNTLGISVTDFYITSTSYADVNVEPKTTYYYTVKPVLAEARPFEGIDEKLGEAIDTFVVTTGNQVYKPGVFKHFILLKLDDPNMSVDGINQEVDPGRNTAPILVTGRTMVPIRAVVEAMGGNIGWDGNTKNITLEARSNKVEMWLEKTDINVNGTSKKMDVSPILKNERTFLPIRFVAENLNCKVDWINSTKEIVIVYEE